MTLCTPVKIAKCAQITLEASVPFFTQDAQRQVCFGLLWRWASYAEKQSLETAVDRWKWTTCCWVLTYWSCIRRQWRGRRIYRNSLWSPFHRHCSTSSRHSLSKEKIQTKSECVRHGVHVAFCNVNFSKMFEAVLWAHCMALFGFDCDPKWRSECFCKGNAAAISLWTNPSQEWQKTYSYRTSCQSTSCSQCRESRFQRASYSPFVPSRSYTRTRCRTWSHRSRTRTLFYRLCPGQSANSRDVSC